MKVVVIGCTHAGTAAIVSITERFPSAEVTVYEENDNVSFLSCGIALLVADVVKDAKGLFYSSPAALKERGANVCMRHEVLAVDMANKTLQVKNLETQEVFEDAYDKLIITTGSWPIVPNIENHQLNNIVLCKNYDHTKRILNEIKTTKKAVVVGAGYIGVELAEAFQVRGVEVTLIDLQDRILAKYLDPEFTDIAEKAMTDAGIRLALGENVQRFEGDENGNVTKVITTNGEYEADLVVLCIGFRPNTGLFDGQLDTLANGALVIDDYMQTSQKDVFAAGDCCAIHYNPTGKQQYIPLATNAVRMGTLISYNLEKPTQRYLGTQGTSGIKIYDYAIASTGLTEVSAKEEGIEIGTSLIEESYRPDFMPTHEKIMIKVVYDQSSRRILGAQILSKVDLTASVNTLSVCIQNQMTIEDLAFVDFFFQPYFNQAWNYLNQVALNAIGAPKTE